MVYSMRARRSEQRWRWVVQACRCAVKSSRESSRKPREAACKPRGRCSEQREAEVNPGEWVTCAEWVAECVQWGLQQCSEWWKKTQRERCVSVKMCVVRWCSECENCSEVQWEWKLQMVLVAKERVDPGSECSAVAWTCERGVAGVRERKAGVCKQTSEPCVAVCAVCDGVWENVQWCSVRTWM